MVLHSDTIYLPTTAQHLNDSSWYCNAVKCNVILNVSEALSLNFALYGHNTKMNCIYEQMKKLKINAQPHNDKQRLTNIKTLYKAAASRNGWQPVLISVWWGSKLTVSCILTLSQVIHWLIALSRTRSPVVLRHCEFALRSPLDPILAVDPDLRFVAQIQLLRSNRCDLMLLRTACSEIKD